MGCANPQEAISNLPSQWSAGELWLPAALRHSGVRKLQLCQPYMFFSHPPIMMKARQSGFPHFSGVIVHYRNIVTNLQSCNPVQRKVKSFDIGGGIMEIILN